MNANQSKTHTILHTKRFFFHKKQTSQAKRRDIHLDLHGRHRYEKQQCVKYVSDTIFGYVIYLSQYLFILCRVYDSRVEHV